MRIVEVGSPISIGAAFMNGGRPFEATGIIMREINWIFLFLLYILFSLIVHFKR